MESKYIKPFINIKWNESIFDENNYLLLKTNFNDSKRSWLSLEKDTLDIYFTWITALDENHLVIGTNGNYKEMFDISYVEKKDGEWKMNREKVKELEDKFNQNRKIQIIVLPEEENKVLSFSLFVKHLYYYKYVLYMPDFKPLSFPVQGKSEDELERIYDNFFESCFNNEDKPCLLSISDNISGTKLVSLTQTVCNYFGLDLEFDALPKWNESSLKPFSISTTEKTNTKRNNRNKLAELISILEDKESIEKLSKIISSVDKNVLDVIVNLL